MALYNSKRFEIINKARSVIEECDWFVFLDADTRVVSEITEEEFFSDDEPYFGVHHPCHALKMQPHDKIPGAWDQKPIPILEAWCDREMMRTSM